MTKKVKKLVDEFCRLLQKNFPEVTYEIIEKNTEKIEIIAYTPRDNIGEIADAMADFTTDVLIDGGPYIYVVPVMRKEEEVI